MHLRESVGEDEESVNFSKAGPLDFENHGADLNREREAGPCGIAPEDYKISWSGRPEDIDMAVIFERAIPSRTS